MIVGIGMLKILPLPKRLKSSGNPQIGLPSVYIYDAPRQIVINERVTIKGVILNRVINNPATVPEHIPIDNPANNASGKEISKGMLSFNIDVAITPLNATIAPTDRSMPAVRMTNVIPAAIIAVMEVWSVTFSILSAVKKYGENKENKIISKNNAMVIPNSLMMDFNLADL